MRKLKKTKRGFTLVELVLVLAIIIILASVTALSVSDILNNSKKGQSSVAEEVTTMKQNIQSKESNLKGYGF